METLKCIKSRRSRRQFSDKKISDEDIDKILECAISAPSSKDSQPWNFIAVKNQENKRKIASLKDSEEQKNIINSANIIIVVCVDKNKSPVRYIEDGVLATENILLAVHDIGLGAVYMCARKMDDNGKLAKTFRGYLNIPEYIEPITIIPIGNVDNNEILEGKDQINLKDITHFEKW